ncbi:hypothetical protein ACGFYA_29165 [Streptomyces sp. NPDC048305]|uniref:hypothetical protein n=1 Tax=Streptomyces sp. NPDC048305 TaxID=3365532 RepID=UPI00371D1052
MGEPSSLHDGDEAWFKDRPVQVAGHLFPPRFRMWLSYNATCVDMCVALEVDRGGFVEQVNATTVGGATLASATAELLFNPKRLCLSGAEQVTVA